MGEVYQRMIVKAVTFFLIGIAVLAMFGKIRRPQLPKFKRAKTCSKCGTPIAGRGGCPCKSKRS